MDLIDDITIKEDLDISNVDTTTVPKIGLETSTAQAVSTKYILNHSSVSSDPKSNDWKKCNLCPASLPTWQKLLQHVNVVHNHFKIEYESRIVNEESKFLKAENEAFETLEKLDCYPTQNTCPQAEEPWFCTWCGCDIDTEKVEHMKKHFQSMYCSFCNEDFKCYYTLNDHMKVNHSISKCIPLL